MSSVETVGGEEVNHRAVPVSVPGALRALCMDNESARGIYELLTREVMGREREIEGKRRVRARLLGLGGRELEIREATCDAKVVVETFQGMFHLPPVKLPQDAVILDLGANIGATAADMGTRWARARVWCVEMDEENAKVCAQNVAWMGERARVERGAVWVRNGRVAYGGKEYWSRRVRGIWDLPNKLSDPEIGSVEAIGARDLVERVLRTWKPRRGVIDYVKIDVEGSEAAIFEGDVGWLKHVDAIRVHVHPPVTIDRIISRLTTGGMIATRCWKHHRSVVGVSRGAAARMSRWPEPALRIEPDGGSI